jgi:hypothetical protein
MTISQSVSSDQKHPTRAIVSVVHKNVLFSQGEFDTSNRTDDVLMGAGTDIPIDVPKEPLLELYNGTIINVVFRPGMTGVIKTTDGKVIPITAMMPPERKNAATRSLVDVRMLSVCVKDYTLNIQLLRANETLGMNGPVASPVEPMQGPNPQEEGFMVAMIDGGARELGSALPFFMWSNEDLEHHQFAAPGKTLQIGLGTAFTVPELNQVASLVTWHGLAEGGVLHYRDLPGWKCWMLTDPNEAPRDFDALRAGRCVIEREGSLDIPFPPNALIAVAVESALFLLAYLPKMPAV